MVIMSALIGQRTETVGLSYSVRPGLRASERTFRLQPDSLFWHDARRTACIPYAQIMKMRLFSYGNFGLLVWNCTMKDRSGRKFGLTSAHYVRLGTFEDRMKTFAP